MRLKNLIVWDIRFQIKHGFYFIYVLLTVSYIVLLFAFPWVWRQKASTIMIFSDPAAIGLFFMGAIILLEKSQRVLSALAVSPVTVIEYTVSKVISLGVISVLVALVLALVTGVAHLPVVLLGTVLTSSIFTLLGLIAAANITSLNQFIIVTVPIEIVCVVPALLYLFDFGPTFLRFYPINICMGMVAGNIDNISIGIVLTVLLIAVLFLVAYRCTLKMWKSIGGVKL